jgi:hypothetical protein
MQEPQLHDDQEQEEAQRTSGDKEILQYLSQADSAQGSEIALEGLEGRPDLSSGESSNG